MNDREDIGVPGGRADVNGARGDGRPWHARDAQAALDELGSGPDGLTVGEATARRARHGPNTLPGPARRLPLARLAAQFHSALIYFLLLAAGAAWFLGHEVDAAVIVAVVLINAVIGFIQEDKAEKALAAIHRLILPGAVVIRDGRRRTVPAADLVPGDLVCLEAGDRVPADVRLVRAKGLLIDESMLTGESVAAEKDTVAVPVPAPLAEWRGMAFSGTLVAAGQGAGVVVETGEATQIGRISRLLGAVEPLTTPLLRQVDAFGRGFAWVALGAAAMVFAFAVLVRGYAWHDALIAVVALAVGAVPEGLPAVITITLAIGVRRMAARQAVIRRLPAVETLGAVSVICSDKTGTLTLNEMTARRIVAAGQTVRVGGMGYAPEGGLSAEDGRKPSAAVLWLVRAGLLCNDAHVRQDGGHWRSEGDPMEGALACLAMKAGLDPRDVRTRWPRADEIPFDAQYRYMATLHAPDEGDAVVCVKGAPEALLALCHRQMGAAGGEEPLDVRAWEAEIARAGAAGERVLGFACKTRAAPGALTHGDLADGLVFLGIVGFMDPPRPEAVEAIGQCRAAGIDVKMITGDHAVTAGAIARQLGMADGGRVLTGADIQDLDDAALADRAADVAVFARADPEHKLRIVRALQARGTVVAMTGDGVNDAPALRQADVGVAMGRKGTEAAKEAAEMVLIDENFASIVAAVREGRTVYDNIRKVIAWTLPTNGGEALTVILAILLGVTMPLSAVQILWINLVTSVTLGLALAFEPREPGVMRRPPRAPGLALLSPFLVWRIVLVSALFAAGAFAVFAYAQARGLDLAASRTLVVNAIVAFEIAYLFNVRYLHRTSFSLRGALGTPAVLIAVALVTLAQLAFTYVPVVQGWFDTRPLAFVDLLAVVACGAVLMGSLELEKWLLRRMRVMPGGQGPAPGGDGTRTRAPHRGEFRG